MILQSTGRCSVRLSINANAMPLNADTIPKSSLYHDNKHRSCGAESINMQGNVRWAV